MIEDDIYRTSSQYRYWSYTRASLAELRKTTNQLASERVRAAFRRSRSARAGASNANGSNNGEIKEPSSHSEIDTLTVNEELKIVQWGCTKIVEIGEAMTPPIPMNIVATAIQYLRRFYLTNSPMTYHPKQIMMCALYLATKSDHWHISLHKFIAALPNVTEDDIKAPEFLLMQGLRFTLDVRHPMKGLDGGVGEMQALAEEGLLGGLPVQAAKSRVGKAADQAKKLLRTAAQMTDAYFLYTPSQIWLAALMIADNDLVTSYLSLKIEALGDAGQFLREKLTQTVSSCAELLATHRSPEEDAAERKLMKRIGRKLHVCQNPEKLDIVAVTKARAAEKREVSDGSDADKALKKRKMEREKLERDGDVFGPELKNIGSS